MSHPPLCPGYGYFARPSTDACWHCRVCTTAAQFGCIAARFAAAPSLVTCWHEVALFLPPDNSVLRSILVSLPFGPRSLVPGPGLGKVAGRMFFIVFWQVRVRIKEVLVS
jgi:hypothetical protein